MPWREEPLTLGEPHPGFFYPDPLGFWAEVRRWLTVLLRAVEPSWTASEALSLAALLHVGDDAARLRWAIGVLRPAVVLFLDEPARAASGLDVAQATTHHVPDPHRTGQVYEGLWGFAPDGTVIGKSPQHPAAHRLYRPGDIDEFLQSVPRPA